MALVDVGSISVDIDDVCVDSTVEVGLVAVTPVTLLMGSLEVVLLLGIGLMIVPAEVVEDASLVKVVSVLDGSLDFDVVASSLVVAGSFVVEGLLLSIVVGSSVVEGLLGSVVSGSLAVVV
jgi:hypothetical protein